jgi:Protein of unknown function (DUF4031)
MSVYVDNYFALYRGMKMCHMIADSHAELMEMAFEIGVADHWLQNKGTHREHFDICKAKRKQAVIAGAIEVSFRELGRKIFARRRRWRA